jgi:2-C-methyl-D-erythritol 2,4-cyclodiphosphate synthase
VTEPAVRVGYGRDSHSFGPGNGLRLGGIEIAAAPRLHGHSDGDVALHALAGAILGAAGLGDLGSLFPADDRTPAGVASSDLLADVVGRVAAAGWAPAAAEILIIGARPRLGDQVGEMRAAIAGLVGLEAGAVSVAASSGNLSGDEGAGRTISATAVATLVATGAGR